VSIPKTVERGAAVLDTVLPNWESQIDLETLDMSLGSECGCVLGQLYGDYFEGLRVLEERGYIHDTDERGDFGEALGFHRSLRGVRTWDALTQHWRTLIRRRLAA